jgi:hypothetical protein
MRALLAVLVLLVLAAIGTMGYGYLAYCGNAHGMC